MSGESVPQAPNVYWGQIKSIQINNDHEALQNNLKWAELAVKYARSIIPYVGNDVRDVLKSNYRGQKRRPDRGRQFLRQPLRHCRNADLPAATSEVAR